MSKFKRFDEGTLELCLNSDHFLIRGVRLITNTDYNDTLVEEKTAILYRGSAQPICGQIFIVTSRVVGRSYVIVIPAPDLAMPELRVEKGRLRVDSKGYPIYLGECFAEDAEWLVRSWYREQYKPTLLHSMSNTWGDRNGRTKISHDFIKKEIDSGADLGIDVVQIDDGWQRGIPDVYDEAKNRLFEGDFWELKSEIFPNGIAPLSEYAKAKGVELGLWFAPHSRGVFEHFDRDLSVLNAAYHDWGIRYFKLDMVSLPTKEHCDKMAELLDKVKSFGEDVSVELDVTADKRLGYLASAPYGTIFVENRYTAWGNYYPYRTLRNAWMLSRYIPLSKLQFELVNPELFLDKYDLNDPFRHGICTADYLFAEVMLSNPLFWMETQELSDSARRDLKKIIPTWKQYRSELTAADVRPIGEEPRGDSLTGFIAEGDREMHILIFREATDKEELSFSIGSCVKSFEILLSSAPASARIDGSMISARIGAPRSYLWIRAIKDTPSEA